jgi:hypothetical protein
MSASTTAHVLRAALALTLGVGLGVGLASLLLSEAGQSRVHVFAPAGEAVKVRVDDGDAVHVEPGRRFTRGLAPGDHEVRLEREGRAAIVRRVRVERAGQRWVVPVGDDQCFVEVDVTRSAYGEGGAATVERRRRAEAFEVSASTYLSRAELPRSRRSDEAVILVSPIACDSIHLADPALLAHVPHD